MASYKLSIKRSVTKDLRRLPKKDIAKILESIASLADDPRPPGAEKLSAQDKYRIRQGIYRIIYQIMDEELVVMVVKVGHRRAVYKTG